MSGLASNVFATKRGVVIFHEWLVGAGGAERLAVEEYRYLVRRGIPTKLLCFEAAPRGLFGLDAKEVEVLPRKSILDGILRLRRRLADLRPDVVIVAGGVRELYLASLGNAIPYVLHQHEAPYKVIAQERQVLIPLIRREAVSRIREMAYGYRTIPLPPIAKSVFERVWSEVLSVLDCFALRGATAVISLSRRAASEVSLLYGRKAIALCGCLSSEILSHQAGQSLKKMLDVGSRRVVLSISRLDAMKRLDVVIRAFARIAPDLRDAVLVIGGTGPEEEALKRLSEELALGDRLVFLGFVPNEQLWDITATCDVVVCADWTDFDIAPYEALALGRRVVCSSEMETDEELTRMGAVFAVDPSVEGLAEGMRGALAAPEVSRADVVNFLQRYTWDEYFGKVLRIVSESAKTSRGRAVKIGATPVEYKQRV